MSLTNQHPATKKELKKYKQAVNKHLKEFFRLLDSTPKPSTEKIRNEFIRHETELRLFGIQSGLGTRLAELFNANVSLEWERKYTRQSQ